MPAQHHREMPKLVINFVRMRNGLGDGLADGFAPGLAESVELGAEGGVGAAETLGELLERGVTGIGEDPGPERGECLAGGRAAGFQGVEGEAEDVLSPVAVIGIDIHARRVVAIHRSFLMGRRVRGIESFKSLPAATDLGGGAPMLIDQVVVEEAAEVSAEADVGAFSIGIVGEEMRLLTGQAEGGEFRCQVVDVRFRESWPVLADVTAQGLGVGVKKLPESALLLLCRPNPQRVKRGMIRFWPDLLRT